MIDFLKACDIARKVLLDDGYRDGFEGILDVEDSWLFFGKDLEDGVVEYGNDAVKINKISGATSREPAYISCITDYKKEPVEIEVPKKYMLKNE